MTNAFDVAFKQTHKLNMTVIVTVPNSAPHTSNTDISNTGKNNGMQCEYMKHWLVSKDIDIISP